MNTILIFLAKYLVYLLVSWVLVSGWYLRRTHTLPQLLIWLAKIGLACAVTYILVKLGNNFFPEVRPFVAGSFQPLTESANDPSFPSSHAAIAAVFATFMWNLRRDWGVAAFILVILVGVGRVGVGVHYPIDILGGVVIGVLAALSVLKFWPKNLG